MVDMEAADSEKAKGQPKARKKKMRKDELSRLRRNSYTVAMIPKGVMGIWGEE